MMGIVAARRCVGHKARSPSATRRREYTARWGTASATRTRAFEMPLDEGQHNRRGDRQHNKGPARCAGRAERLRGYGPGAGKHRRQHRPRYIRKNVYGAGGTRRLETGNITTGPATIVSTVSGRQPEEYDVEINRIYRDAGGEHVMLTVVDSELCAHGRHSAGHVRQPHIAGRASRGRGDACVRQRPDARLRREHTGHARLRRGEGQGGVN